MSEIPEDVMKAHAEAMARKVGYISLDSPDKITRGWFLRMAREVLAERERCAKIAEGRRGLYSRFTSNGQLVCTEIASSIRPQPPMTGFLSTLTPAQREAAIQGFDGDDTLGHPLTDKEQK